MAWPLRRLPAVSFLINTTWNPHGSFRLFPWCQWPFAELPLSNKAPRIRSPSLGLSLFLSGSIELSGSWRAESSAPVPPGGRQKTNAAGRRPWHYSGRGESASHRKFPCFYKEATLTSCRLSWTEKKWISLKRREKKVFFMHRLRSLAKTFYTVESIRHRQCHLFIPLFQLLFFAHFYFLSVRLSRKREPDYERCSRAKHISWTYIFMLLTQKELVGQERRAHFLHYFLFPQSAKVTAAILMPSGNKGFCVTIKSFTLIIVWLMVW